MIPFRWVWCLVVTALLASQVVTMTINEDDPASVKKAAAAVASDTMRMYEENIDKTGIIGKLDGTWWVGGALFMTMIQYWYLTGDDTYNQDVIDGMMAQKGAHNNYFPSNWSSYLGNDDQVFWGLAAMTAAELNFPENDDQPSWVALAQGVFNNQVPRWDDQHCGGGMRWQIWPYQAGYTLKNSVSNGGLFQLSSRLHYYTNNQTYADWANKIWDWSISVPLVDVSKWMIADSTNNQNNCTNAGMAQWTYNYGMYISGSAYMYNSTNGDQKWKDRIDGLMPRVFKEFFPKRYGGKILSEYNCEIPKNCDGNSACFKGFLASWLAFMTTLVPGMTQEIVPKLKASAVAAAQQCSGGSGGNLCGMKWFMDTYDGTKGIGREMSALSVMSSSLIEQKSDPAPKSAKTGGKSKPDPSTGTGGSTGSQKSPADLPDVSKGDKAGAAIVTVIFVCGWIAAMTYMVWGN